MCCSLKKLLLLLTLIIIRTSFAQEQKYPDDIRSGEYDKCGYVINDSDQPQYISPLYMGYSYDSLLTDLELWRLSSYVKIDSIGLSVQGRPLWQLTISSDPNNVTGKRTVHIHARTHPQETEGFFVTDEIVKILLSETEFAQTVRAKCVFYIIPMYNPDGVELGHPRTNANNIDLESNWNTFPHQPEVAALKARFTQLMASPNPIEVMLNMHSSSSCSRYFVYHHEIGTSTAYAQLEQNFINGVRNYFPGGIKPFTYYVSWTSGTALQYPESWCWLNHGESIMALTYEDMYRSSCSTSGYYDSTANAILRGVMDYMGIVTGVENITNITPTGFELYQNYPNPFNPVTTIKYTIPNVVSTEGRNLKVTLKVYDILGTEIATLVNEEKTAGTYEVNFSTTGGVSKLTSGIYFYRLQVIDSESSSRQVFISTKKMVLIK